jgi:hypothetical protein
VSWWTIGNHAIAMSESPDGIVIDPNIVEQKGAVKYLATNLGKPETRYKTLDFDIPCPLNTIVYFAYLLNNPI